MRLPFLRSLLTCCLLFAASGCGPADTEQEEAKNFFLEARTAKEQGDSAKALAAFTASIESKPNAWAYMERAKLQAEAGQEQQARQDSDAAVKLEPDNQDALWLQAELNKPAEQRFQGIFKIPPSGRK
jgi:tetratricopeptide (TPR) repeat protein